jgi:hypothetical protein
MIQCADCGKDNITIEQFKRGTTKCRECTMAGVKRLSDQFKARQAAKSKLPKPTNEENWGGPCRGGCGKINQGEYYCADCRMKDREKAFALQPGETEIYRAQIGKPEDKVLKQIVVTEADSVELDNVTWIWKNKIPVGTATWCLGQPNNGKSLMTIEIVACVTTGRDFPDGSKNETPPSRVLMYCGEDSPGKVVLPRLKAAGADTSKVSFFDRKSFRTFAGDNEPERRPLNLTQDLDDLIEFSKVHPEYKMIVADPITGIFGSKNINKNEEANPVLEHLIDFCEETGIAFLGVLHVPKRTTNSAIEKIAGGSAVGGSAKSAFMLSRDPDSEDIHDHMLTMVKWNYASSAEGLKYKTVSASVDWKGRKIDTAKIEWGEVVGTVADDVLAKQNSKTVERDRQQDRCDAFLRTYLSNGHQKSKDVYDAATAQGFGSSTVKRSVINIKAHHVDGRKYGKQGWYMSMTENPFDEPTVEERAMTVGVGEGL